MSNAVWCLYIKVGQCNFFCISIISCVRCVHYYVLQCNAIGSVYQVHICTYVRIHNTTDYVEIDMYIDKYL